MLASLSYSGVRSLEACGEVQGTVEERLGHYRHRIDAVTML